MIRLLLLAAALAADPVTPPVGADPVAWRQHLDLAAEAERAEDAGEAEHAVRACRDAIAVLPDGPRVAHCEHRLAFLDRRRDADGTFGAWDRLEHARRRKRRDGRDATRAAILGVLGGEGVSPVVTADASLWLAIDALDHRGDAEAALDLLSSVYAQRDQLRDDPHLHMGVVLTQARALARLGRAEEAAAVEDEVRVRTTDRARRLTPAEEESLTLARARFDLGAWAVLAGFGGLAGILGVRHGPGSARRPWGLLPLLLAGLAGWVVSARWDEPAARPWPWLLLGWSAVHLLSLVGTSDDVPGPLRLVVRLGAVAATVAVGWLALHGTHSLGWIGL